MTGKKSGAKKKNPGLQVLNAVLIGFCCLALLAAGAMGWFVYKQQQELEAKKSAAQQEEEKGQAELAANPPPRTLVNDSVEETVRYAAQHGWYPCPGDCLKLATPGWHHEHIGGFADSDWWMSYRYSEGVQRFSQRHAGHLIKEFGDKPARDVGACPECGGIGWVKKPAAK